MIAEEYLLIIKEFLKKKTTNSYNIRKLKNT